MIYLILIPIIICILIFYLSSSLLYKIVFLTLGLFIATTVGLYYINILLKDNINKSKIIARTKNDNSDCKSVKHPTKIINNESYNELIETLKFCMKNKLLNREQILDFKTVVVNHLGNHKDSYKGMKFNNDLHYIYTVLKNDYLKTNDYEELLIVLENYKIN